MKKIYKSKLFVFSVLAFLAMNMFGLVYAQEDSAEGEGEEKLEIILDEKEAIKEETVNEVLEDQVDKESEGATLKEEDIKLALVRETRNEPIATEFERLFIEGRAISGETHIIRADVKSSKKLLYRFYEKNLRTNKWTRIQDYSEKNSIDWIPKGKGDYRYRVDIKEAASKKDSDISKSALIRIEPSLPAVLNSLELIGTNEAKTPHKIQAKATAVNGALYKFYIRNKTTGAVNTIQNYSEKDTVEWTPEEAGNYEYGVNVKDKKSWEDVEDSKVISVEMQSLKPAVLHSLELKGNRYEKNTQTLTANASSTNEVLYKFYVKDERTGSTETLQNFSTKNTASWKPMRHGEYTYNVAVKDIRSDRGRDALLSYKVNINPPMNYVTTQYKETLEEAVSKQTGTSPTGDNKIPATKEEIRRYLNPKNYLQFDPKVTNGESMPLISVEVKTQDSNLRSEAKSGAKVLTTLKSGDVYVVLEEKNNWYKINSKGKIGWISGNDAVYVNDVPKDMYQFMVLSGQAGVTVAQMNKELKGMGILEGHGAAFIEGSKRYNVNELYLMAHAFLETGRGTSPLSRGIWVDTVDGKPVPRRKVYNMYGIGAKNQAPNRLGSEMAYKQGWFTPEIAIREGAHWISNGYINHPEYKQDTLYKMRFYPEKLGHWHKYATDVAWAYKQRNQISEIMEYAKHMEGIVLKFDIPVYREK